MTSPTAEQLVIQKQMLRQMLLQQREYIAVQLTQSLQVADQYPRSITMRFFTREPGIRLLGRVATLLVGARVLKAASTAYAVSKLVRAVVRNNQN